MGGRVEGEADGDLGAGERLRKEGPERASVPASVPRRPPLVVRWKIEALEDDVGGAVIEVGPIDLAISVHRDTVEEADCSSVHVRRHVPPTGGLHRQLGVVVHSGTADSGHYFSCAPPAPVPAPPHHA